VIIYDLRCENSHRFEGWFHDRQAFSDQLSRQLITCPVCGSLHVERRIGRIRVAHSDESRLEGMADPSQLEGLDEDPRALGRMMRQMKSSVGEDMGPVFDEVVDRLEAGQSPEDIDSAIPDLGSDLGAGDDF